MMNEDAKKQRRKIREYCEYHGDRLHRAKRIFAAFGGVAYALEVTGEDGVRYGTIVVEDCEGDFHELESAELVEADDFAVMVAAFQQEEKEQEGQ